MLWYEHGGDNMRYPLFVVILFAAFCFGQNKPPEPPPTEPTFNSHWFSVQPLPPIDPTVQYMIDHPAEVMRILREANIEDYCNTGPVNSDTSPEVKRCDSVI